MTRITRYIGREVAVPALLALVVLCFLGVANEVRERVKDFDFAHIQVMDFARMSLFVTPTLVQYVVPATYLFGIMLALGRLAQHNEITAMQAAGIPLKRIALPIAAGGLVLSGVAFELQDFVQPKAWHAFYRLVYQELPQRVTLNAMIPGVMYEFGPWRVYLGGRDEESGALEDLAIIDRQDTGALWVYHARRAEYREDAERPHVYIPEGYLVMQSEGPGSPGGRAKLTDFRLYLPDPPPPREPTGNRFLSVAGLLRKDRALGAEIRAAGALDSLESLYKPYYDLEVPQGVSLRAVAALYSVRNDLRERIAYPLACLAVSLAAAPLALRGRRGGRSYSFAVGFGLCVGYYLLHRLSQPLGLVSLYEVVLRGVLPALVFLIAGGYAIWRVDRVG